MKNKMSLWIVALLLPVLLVLPRSQAQADEKPQLVILTAEADQTSGTILIQGRNFLETNQSDVTVTLAENPLVIQSVSDMEIWVELPAGVVPGTYLLTVSRGQGSVKNDAFDLTIGAVGPAGPRGPQGEVGPVGPQGPEGGTSATPENIPRRIVLRDGTGSFSAGTIGLGGNLALPDTASVSVGTITLGGFPFLHNFGTANTFVGAAAGNFTLTGTANGSFGHRALASITGGWDNNAFGDQALRENTTGYVNSAFGSLALLGNTAGKENSAFGYMALINNTTDSENTALGSRALSGVGAGLRNIAVGAGAGAALHSGSYNIYIGHPGANTESQVIRIGSIGTHRATYIAGISDATSAGGVTVYVSSDGKLGTVTSSRRYKEQIADMHAESDVLMKLRPVSFYYRPELDETQLRQYGLIAEEVATVAPDLVAYDNDGTPQTVRYHFVNAMLLNEVQKQRQLVEGERRENEAQKMTIAALEARLAMLEAALAGDR